MIVKWRLDQRMKDVAWEKSNPKYFILQNDISNGAVIQEDILKDNLKDLNSVQIFEKLVDDRIIQFIAEQIMLYAQQNNKHDLIVTSTKFVLSSQYFFVWLAPLATRCFGI